jgi:predicted metal-dependent hydrolase
MFLQTRTAGRGPAKKPVNLQVKARRIDFAFEPDLARYWYDGDAFLTHFMHALSITFPDGERMFMDAVRAVQSRVQNEETRADIAGFMGQEALHSRAHEALNAFIAARGYPALSLAAGMREQIEERKPEHSKKSALALTCALEHITAIMGHRLLASPELQAMMPASMRRLWVWHALEETEHKAVAFDVYQEVFGDLRTRNMWLVISTLGLMSTVLRFQTELLKHDGLAHKPSIWLKGMWRLWGPRGILLPLVPAWLSYFKADFHPWQVDDSALIQRYRTEFDEAASYTKKSGGRT